MAYGFDVGAWRDLGNLEHLVGLIRKSLAISTAGVVRPSSKKQRVAKKTLNATREGARATKQTADAARQIAQAPPVWQEGDRVVIMQLGYRGKQGEVVKQGRLGCTVMLDDGKTVRAVDARKLERAPNA